MREKLPDGHSSDESGVDGGRQLDHFAALQESRQRAVEVSQLSAADLRKQNTSFNDTSFNEEVPRIQKQQQIRKDIANLNSLAVVTTTSTSPLCARMILL